MAQTNAERQRAWRERHRGEPRGNAAMQAQLVALQARVAQLDEVELSLMPSASPRAPSGRLREAYLAVRGSATNWWFCCDRSRLTSQGLRRRLGWRRLMGYLGGTDEAHRTIDSNFRITVYPDIRNSG